MKRNTALKFFYPLLVWIITLTAGPAIWIGYQLYAVGIEGIGMIEIILPMLLISIFMSLPTLLAIVIAYIMTTKKVRDSNLIRLILLIITLCGIWISFFELGGTLKFQLAIAYSAASVIAILFTTPEKKIVS